MKYLHTSRLRNGTPFTVEITVTEYYYEDPPTHVVVLKEDFDRAKTAMREAVFLLENLVDSHDPVMDSLVRAYIGLETVGEIYWGKEGMNR